MTASILRSAFAGSAGLGVFADHVLPDPFEVTTVTLGGPARATPVFSADGHAFVADSSGTVTCLKADLSEAWRVVLEGGITAAPCVSDDDQTVFVGTHAGWVYALNTEDGSECWKVWLESGSDPRILSDLLYTRSRRVICSSWGGAFVALDAGDGHTVHTWTAGVYPRSAASQTGEVVCSSRVEWTDDLKALVFSRMTDETFDQPFLIQHTSAESPRDAGLYAPPLETPFGTLLFCNRKNDCLIHVLPDEEGSPQYTMPFPVPVYTAPAVDSARFVFGAMNGYVYSFRPNGKMNFAYKTEAEYLTGGPVCDRESIYVGDLPGRIHQIDASGSGRILVRTERAFEGRFSFSPAGALYAPCSDGRLYVLA